MVVPSYWLALPIAACLAVVAAAEPQLLPLQGDLAVHDPVLAKAEDTYYLFSTGSRRRGGILPIYVSQDMRQWRRVGSAIDRFPEWVARELPRARTAWAPDISHFNGKYHLYYSLSSFGTNDSGIALVTNASLDPSSPEYDWVDEGLIIRSRPGEDDFNAIDPNIAIEDDENIWLSWGSFWDGIMMRRINPRTGRLCDEDATLHHLAARPRQVGEVIYPVGGPIEAPFLVRRGGHWYLFVSWDYCCRGARSDYKVVVGRSENITGPYVDQDGTPMTEGGGLLVIEAATDRWRGAGHPAVYHEDGVDYLLFHAYSAETGRSRLQISTLMWEDGWPQAAALP